MAIGDFLLGTFWKDGEHLPNASVATTVDVSLEHQTQDLPSTALLLRLDEVELFGGGGVGIEPVLQFGKGLSSSCADRFHGGRVERNTFSHSG